MAYEFTPAQADDVIANERLTRNFYSLIEDQTRFVEKFVLWAEQPFDEREHSMEDVISGSKDAFEDFIRPVMGRLPGYQDYEQDDKARQIANACKIVRETRQQLLKDAYPNAMIFFADDFDDKEDDDRRLLEDEEAVAKIIDSSRGNINAIIAQLGHFYRPAIIADGNVVLKAVDSSAKFSAIPPPKISEVSYSFSAFNRFKDFVDKNEVPKEALVAATAIALWSVGHLGVKVTKSMLKHR